MLIYLTDTTGNGHSIRCDEWECIDDKIVFIGEDEQFVAMFFVDKIVGFEVCERW